MHIHANSRYAVASLLLLAAAFVSTSSSAQSVDAAAQSGILRFNHKLEDATRRMDNDATLALWDDDGISLLPDSRPILGKPAIAAFMNRVTASLKGARMEKFEMQCSGIEISLGKTRAASGDLATEWCAEHQIVTLPGNQPPFDGRGQMLLVLRRNGNGDWHILREMWNQAAKE